MDTENFVDKLLSIPSTYSILKLYTHFNKMLSYNVIVFYSFALQIEVVDANLRNFSICVVCSHMLVLNKYI